MNKLTEDQVKFYDENGYIVIDLLDENEADELEKAYTRVFESKKGTYNIEATWEGNWKTEEERATEFHCVHGMQMHSAAFTKLLLNEALLDAAESVMRTPNILLHHTKANAKPPGKGSPFPMHQDAHYMPHKKDSLIAALVAVTDCLPTNGGMCVYPGSHKNGFQEDVSDAKGFHYLDPKKFPREKAMPVTLKRGQVMLLSYLTIHGSYANESDSDRKIFLIELMDAADEPLDDAHISVTQGLVLRGWNPKRDADISKRVGQTN